jgi:hypothetical protein
MSIKVKYTSESDVVSQANIIILFFLMIVHTKAKYLRVFSVWPVYVIV